MSWVGTGRLLPIPMWKSVWMGDGRASWRHEPNCSVDDDRVVRTKAWEKTPKVSPLQELACRSSLEDAHCHCGAGGELEEAWGSIMGEVDRRRAGIPTKGLTQMTDPVGETYTGQHE